MPISNPTTTHRLALIPIPTDDHVIKAVLDVAGDLLVVTHSWEHGFSLMESDYALMDCNVHVSGSWLAVDTTYGQVGICIDDCILTITVEHDEAIPEGQVALCEVSIGTVDE